MNEPMDIDPPSLFFTLGSFVYPIYPGTVWKEVFECVQIIHDGEMSLKGWKGGEPLLMTTPLTLADVGKSFVLEEGQGVFKRNLRGYMGLTESLGNNSKRWIFSIREAEVIREERKPYLVRKDGYTYF